MRQRGGGKTWAPPFFFGILHLDNQDKPVAHAVRRVLHTYSITRAQACMHANLTSPPATPTHLSNQSIFCCMRNGTHYYTQAGGERFGQGQYFKSLALDKQCFWYNGNNVSGCFFNCWDCFWCIALA